MGLKQEIMNAFAEQSNVDPKKFEVLGDKLADAIINYLVKSDWRIVDSSTILDVSSITTTSKLSVKPTGLAQTKRPMAETDAWPGGYTAPVQQGTPATVTNYTSSVKQAVEIDPLKLLKAGGQGGSLNVIGTSELHGVKGNSPDPMSRRSLIKIFKSEAKKNK